MALVHANRPYKFFATPEWSFGTAILFGQALVKFISGVAHGGRAAAGAVALAVALVVVFGLVPSLFVLSIILETVEANKSVQLWLQYLQVILFIVAASTYVVLGAVGESWYKKSTA